jgi:hypothetical protein
VTLDGAPASWVTLLPHLITIALRESFYRRGVWRCRCEVGRCEADPREADLPGGSWSRCPYELLRSAQFVLLIQLERCAAVAPLAGWPHDFPAWLSWGLVTLRERRERGRK